MSIRLKLVSCISAFILVLGIFIFGVLSAEQATVNLGGSISFEATDVYARVTGRVQNAQDNPTLETLEFSADNDTPDQSSWSGLQLQFDSQATNITIEVTVENLSMERTLTVNLTDMIEPPTDNLSKTITIDGAPYASGANTAPIPVATSNDNTNTSKVTFLITFDVIDHNRSLQSTDFDYNINLYDESVAPEPPTSASSFRFSFNDTEHTATITGFVGSETEVVIPSSVNKLTDTTGTEGSDYRVTSIGYYAFSGCDGLTSVDFEDNSQLTSISSSAFSGCSSLETINIPASVTSIGSSAFSGCRGLSEINYNLTSYLDFSMTNDIFDYAGQDGTGITVNIGANVIRLPNYMFYSYRGNTPNIVAVNFAENSECTRIGFYAFSECSGLTSITIPEGVTIIGEEAFSYCDSLTEIVIPDSVTTIGRNAFRDCASLTSTTIGEGVTRINEGAFDNCYALAEVYNYSPNITVKLGETSRYNNGYLGGYAKVVYNAGDLTGVKPATRIKDSNRVRYYDDGENTVVALYPLSRDITTVSLDSNTTEIQLYAFENCTSLTSITIPSSVTSIGFYAFSGCDGLTSVDFEDNSQLTSISSSAFSGCSSLESITIPSRVTSIGYGAFPDCSSLTSIEVDQENQNYSSEDGVLFNKDKTTLIQYPIGNTRTSYTIPSSVTNIDPSAFWGCDSLTSITIPSSVTSIGNSAFWGCDSLTSITIPSSVTNIGFSAFSGCTNLNNVTIESEDIYLDLTGQYACGYLINYVNATGKTVRVLKSVVDTVDPDFTVNTYLNGSNFTRSVSEDGLYYIYTHN